MKIKEKYNVRELLGNYIMVVEDSDNIDVTNVVNLNETCYELFKYMKGRDATEAELVAYLCAIYEVEQSVAQADVKSIVAQFNELGIIE